ncbi:HNH endonuclease signature motif containing protein [Corynebacterium macginleyi]|uniref:HNH endonuclease signature motif containing protein n=1 Tax=Corynebacterium macginleyi TaxID=38290 RepID=UPI00190D8768|nr:HNH endonuclease signature motif containing protein [Corynebacterium macginleyi]MBK4137782.1 HNH endonuclease [Corynebacterium macginleyi]MBK4147120.1 HNH endonuclease [Corynebacterium macginleyi]MBM0263230.1 HNH endonuclease [Corynebacterium macginleyi]
MNALHTFLKGLTPGMDIIADCHGLSQRELTAAGCPDTTATRLLTLAETYFGTTAFRRQQRESIAACRANGHSLTALLTIERHAAKLKKKRDAWALRRELCGMKGKVSEIDKRARVRVKELKGPVKRKPGVKIYRRADGPWTMSITGPSADIADMHAAIDKEAPLASVRSIFHGSATARPSVTTNVVLHLDELDRIVDFGPGPQPSSGSDSASGPDSRSGPDSDSRSDPDSDSRSGSALGPDCRSGSGSDDDIVVQLTNGATMTGAELVRRTFTEHGYVTLIHPVEGPVNLYRTSRFASAKQRLMAATENPVCPWPKCRYPADECQVHHLTAWKNGGETNPRNLTIACPYHNGVNDDDPNAPPVRGHLARVNGTIQWLPPWADNG